MSTTIQKVLVLNADFSFLTAIHWQKAVSLIFKSNTSSEPIVEPVGNKIVKRVKTSKGEFIVPRIIRLIKFVRSVFKNQVPYSKSNIMSRDDHKCQFSGCNNKAENIDHVIPRALGGKSSWENCVASCMECNSKKGHKTLKEAGMKLKRKPYQPTITEFIQYKLKKIGIKDLMKEIQECYQT